MDFVTYEKWENGEKVMSDGMTEMGRDLQAEYDKHEAARLKKIKRHNQLL